MLDAARNYVAQVGRYPHSWARNYGVFTASIIAIIYLPSAPPEELETVKAHAEDGIAQLKALPATARLDLGDTADTLRTLMNNQLARRESALSPRGLKRSFNDFVFQQWGGLWVSQRGYNVGICAYSVHRLRESIEGSVPRSQVWILALRLLARPMPTISAPYLTACSQIMRSCNLVQGCNAAACCTCLWRCGDSDVRLAERGCLLAEPYGSHTLSAGTPTMAFIQRVRFCIDNDRGPS